jgi:hypothetical protein
MKKVLLWMSLCGLLLVGAACKERHLSDAPNLLLITIDTARADYTSSTLRCAMRHF